MLRSNFLVLLVLAISVPAHGADPPAVDWERFYSVQDTTLEGGFYTMSDAPDGGFFSAGFHGVYHGEPESRDVWLVRQDGDGEVLWEGKAHQVRGVQGSDQDQATQKAGCHIVAMATGHSGFRFNASADEVPLAQRASHQAVDGKGGCDRAGRRGTQARAQGQTLAQAELDTDLDAGQFENGLGRNACGVL